MKTALRDGLLSTEEADWNLAARPQISSRSCSCNEAKLLYDLAGTSHDAQLKGHGVEFPPAPPPP